MSKDSIQVGIKMRPVMAKEKESQSMWRVKDNTVSFGDLRFFFDHVFDESARNQLIFDKMAKHIVSSAVKGFNGTIFAYGQTSSGKTYTMMGGESDPGVMVLAAKEIFSEIEKTSDTHKFLLRVGFIEIYNEKIYDLLNKSNQDLKIHEAGNGNVNVNCHEICVTSEDQLLNILESGNKERTVGETQMNERSSRSHSILRLTIESSDSKNEDGEVTQSLLHLVDLAGSERADQTGARGARLVEGGHINKSLLFLSTVIKRLSENSDAYINYRDSKLTRILQASLGGNAFTSIICTVKPTAIEETQSTLNFAMSAKTIKNKPRVNEVVSDAAAMKRLQREVKELKRQLEEEKLKSCNQLKLSRIEKLLTDKEHTLISSSSLSRSRREKVNRRKTWCPDVANTTIPGFSSPLREVAPYSSRLKPPKNFMTPHIQMRDVSDIRTGSLKSIEEEQFVPAEDFNFNVPLQQKTPPLTKKYVHNDSISPLTPNDSAHYRLIEEEFRQLQEFTDLENKEGVKHDVYKSLKQSIETVYKRNTDLEREHLDYLLLRDDLAAVKDDYIAAEKRCQNLQTEIEILKANKANAEKKGEEYESKILRLQNTIKNLEIENRHAVELQVEFDRHQNKAKLRETELLQALEEKENDLAKLESNLKTLQAEKTAELMQLSQCMVGSVNASDQQQDISSGSSQNSVCMKCEELQRVLEENKTVTLEFEKLASQYSKLQLSYEKSVQQLESTQEQLTELESNLKEQLSTPPKECDKLREEVCELRLNLEKLKAAYNELQLERDEETERCAAINRELELAQQKYDGLESKYNKLEYNWQRQESELANIRVDYENLESKYKELQLAYDSLKVCETKCVHDCQRLQRGNDELQKEIQQLKGRIEQMQQKLSNRQVAAYDDEKSLELDDKSKEEIRQWKKKCRRYQLENEELSNDILDHVEKNEALMKKYSKLEAEIKRIHMRTLALKQSQVVFPNITSRIESKCANDVNILEMCNVLEKKLTEAETHQEQLLTEKATLETKILDLESKITESSNRIENLQLTIDDLRLQNQSLRDDSLIETLQQTITHLREEILRLSKELLERSTILETCLENCSCVEYQHKIDISNLSQSNELLRAQLELSANGSNETNLMKFERIEPLPKPQFIKETIKTEQSNIEIKIEKQSSPNISHSSGDLCSSIYSRRTSFGNKTLCPQEIENVSLSQSVASIETDVQNPQHVKSLQIELKRKEELCAELQLQLLEKLNEAENRFRENLRTYNQEWEQHRLEYETKITDLENALQQAAEKNSIENPNDISLSSSFMLQQQQQKDHQQHQRENNCSTPTTPTSTNTKFLSSSSRKLRNERTQMIAECNERITELSRNVEDLKATNAELSTALLEKTKQLEEMQEKCMQQSAPIDLVASYELALVRALADREIFKAEAVIDYSAECLRNIKIRNLNEFSENLCKGNKEQGADGENQTENDIFHLMKTVNNTSNKRKLHIQKLEKIDEELLAQRNSIKLDAEFSTKIHEKFEPTSKEISQLKSTIEGMAIEIDYEIAKLETLCDHLKAKQARENTEVQIKEKSAAFDQHIVHLESIVRQHEAELAGKDDELKKVENEVNLLKKQRDELESSLKTLRIQETQLQETKQQMEIKFNDIKAENEKLSAELKSEKAEFSTQIGKTAQELENLKKQKEFLEKENKKHLTSFNDVKQENLELQRQLRSLRETHEAATAAIELEKQNLKSELNASQNACAEALDKAETCNAKSEALSQELHTLSLKLQNLMKTVSDYEALEKELDVANKSKEDLVNELNQVRGKENTNNATIEALNCELEAYKFKDNELRQELAELKAKFQADQQRYQREIQDLQSQVNESRLQCDSLKTQNTYLEKSSNDLKQKIDNLKVAHNVQLQQREKISKLEMENQSLTSRLQAMETDAVSKSADLEKQLEQRTVAYNQINQMLDTKSKEFKEKIIKLETTNTCLQDQNKQLSERAEALSELLKNQMAAAALSIDFGNMSLELSTHSNVSRKNSPAGKLPSGEDMSAVLQKERKNRRLSQHDENRRQSTRFTPILADVATMTERIEETCECLVLREKLKENERELLIKKSQVSAYTLELRNHPLKFENEKLIKRIQEEQQKYAKLKVKIEDQALKIQELKDQAKISARMPAAVPEIEPGKLTMSLQRKNAEAQTESEMEVVYHQLESKYRDLKKICRFRANEIRNLEKECNELKNKLIEKENRFKANLLLSSTVGQADGDINAGTQQSTVVDFSVPKKVLGRTLDVKKDNSK